MKNKNTHSSPSWKAQRADSLLDGDNSLYLETLYEQYLENPKQVDPHWQEYFSSLPKINGNVSEQPLSQTRRYFLHYKPQPGGEAVSHAPQFEDAREHDRKQVAILQLINAYRFLGHNRARTNPLEKSPPAEIPELTLAHHDLSDEDLNTEFNTGSLVAPAEMTLGAIIALAKATYCGSVGVEYMHIANTAEKRWVQQKMESVRSTPEYTRSQRRYLLDRLTAAEVLERYLHAKYVGQKRFSLEGAESLIPMLDELIQSAGATGISEVVLGMAHRGRLNVLVNILGKSPSQLFKEFEVGVSNEGQTGDVKYHMGFSSDMNTPGGPVHLAMAFNPSHLEIVGPVVAGAVRARQDHWKENPGNKVLPVVIHGDAAFAGQGVVMETLNMSNIRGFKTRGTIHIIINNQIGFTTSFQRDARSSSYCTDIVKMVDAPIFHVNGDDPEAVVFITQLALEYRMRFAKDVVIDLVCYRRHGHNEADEPAVTQPNMYEKIRKLATTREKYARRLIEAAAITRFKADEMVSMSKKRLEKGDPVVPHSLEDDSQKAHPVDWSRFVGNDWDEPATTSINQQDFDKLAEHLTRLPENFEPHPRVAKILTARRHMSTGELPLDWGFGELMAYASLVYEGHAVRLSGQDSGRGTFFHRHAVFHDQQDGEDYVPLKHISPQQGNFVVIDSLLSEEAVLAFEYGYATTEPDTLVIWEAQFGDFANGAQVVIDQFISSGEQKWGRLSGLTMFLPHGFEGQGPEHSSARPERYLQLCAQHNIQVCIPSTPAQVFHMLRRQMLRKFRKPLIVMTPKSLLRHPLAVSTIESLTAGEFQTVIDEIDPLEPDRVTRLILCTGKIYYDLLERRRNEKLGNVAIIRIEQLYPFPEQQLCDIINRYENIEKTIWCQEEPLNQGAWYSQQHHLSQALIGGHKLEAVARPASASPAVGNLRIHRQQQQEIIENALGLKS